MSRGGTSPVLWPVIILAAIAVAAFFIGIAVAAFFIGIGAML